MVILIAAGAVAVIIGAVGPWATAGLFSKSGIDGDGSITAALAGVLLVIVLIRLRDPTRRMAIGSIIIGIVITAIGIVDIADINNQLSGNRLAAAIVQIGWGLYLTVAAGAFVAIGGAGLIKEARG